MEYRLLLTNGKQQTISCHNCIIENGAASFYTNDELINVISLHTFTWDLKTLDNNSIGFRRSFPDFVFEDLSPHDFSYIVSYSDYENFYVPCNCVILSDNIFYFLDSYKNYVTSFPASASYINPLSQKVMNLRVWNAPSNGIVNITKIVSDSSSKQTSNGTSGTSGIDGKTFMWKGEWTQSETYIPGEIVKYKKTAWICLDYSLKEEPDTHLKKWNILSESVKGEKGNDGTSILWQGTWKQTDVYNRHDIVRHNNTIWVSLIDNNNTNPEMSPLSWDVLLNEFVSNTEQIFKHKFSPNNSKVVNLFKVDKVIDVQSAILCYNGVDSENTDVFLSIGKTLLGGWELPFHGNNKVYKSVMNDNVSYTLGDTLKIEFKKEIVLKGECIVYIVYKELN